MWSLRNQTDKLSALSPELRKEVRPEIRRYHARRVLNILLDRAHIITAVVIIAVIGVAAFTNGFFRNEALPNTSSLEAPIAKCEFGKVRVVDLVIEYSSNGDAFYNSFVMGHQLVGDNQKSDCITQQDADSRRAVVDAEITANRDAYNAPTLAAIAELNARTEGLQGPAAINTTFSFYCTSDQRGKAVYGEPVHSSPVDLPSFTDLVNPSMGTVTTYSQGSIDPYSQSATQPVRDEQYYVSVTNHRYGALDQRARELYEAAWPNGWTESQVVSLPPSFDAAASVRCGDTPVYSSYGTSSTSSPAPSTSSNDPEGAIGNGPR